MKKLLIILSAVFVAACSDGEIGGYTESIIKGASAPESNASLEQQPSLLKKSSSPLDEDLSGLDEEELREKLMNSYPWPKAEGVAEPSSSSGSGESSGSSQNILEGSLPMPHNPNTGIIEPFNWQKLAPSFEDSRNYRYGFDQDPAGKDPVVYISTKVNVGITITPFLSNIAYSKYYLLKEDEPLEKINTSGRNFYAIYVTPSSSSSISPASSSSSFESINGAQSLVLGSDKAKYFLYGCKERTNRDPQYLTCFKLQKQIQVIPYEQETKKIVYVEINGDGWRANNTECDDGFTKDCVRNYFNEVYKQAVVDVNITPKTADEFGINKKGLKKELEEFINQKETTKGLTVDDFFKDNLIVVDMTAPANNEPLYKAMLKKAVEHRDNINESDALKKDKTINNKKSPYWRIVYAINKVRKEWHLAKCINDDYDLSACINEYINEQKQTVKEVLHTFKPEDEPYETDYFLDRRKCEGEKDLPALPVKIKIKQKKGKIQYHIDAFEGKYKSCHILYTDNGYPVVPSENAVKGAAAITTQMKDFLYKDYLAYGSIIFVPRRVGKTGLRMLMHELGHSFGLTDVSKSYYYKYLSVKDPLSEVADYDGSSKKDKREYSIEYASAETNLMSWMMPAGIRIRYRSIPFACTGGDNYYEKTIVDEINKITIFDPNSKLGTVEHTISGNGELHQWDCIRDCYDESKDTFVISDRENFWQFKGPCKDNNPGEEGRNILGSSRSYNKANRFTMCDGKILNIDYKCPSD